MKKLRIFRDAALLTIAALSSLSAMAAVPTVANRKLGATYYAYPYPELPLPKLTDAPKGYEPFHMEHYSRHGSRWHIGEWVYKQPIDLLRPAERNGKLTERGKLLMAQLRKTEKQSRNRSGELTNIGAKQHRGIAQRMTKNFPEIFKGDARVDARSTIVIRSILSMDNELQELLAFNPELNITSDASNATMYYMNFSDSIANAKAKDKSAKKILNEYKKTLPDDYSFINLIVSDPQFATDSIDCKNLLKSLYRIAANAQSLDEPTDIYDLLSEENLRTQYIKMNADWFIKFGNTDITDGCGPMRERYLMRNFIESADTAIMCKKPSANMRFGHDVVLLPFAVLLDLDGLDKKCNDLNEVDSFFNLNEITPMASNIQMIFYRPKKGKNYTADDVLVKVLLNEKEVTLPTTAVSGPYYRWTELRKHYLNRINDARYTINEADY